MNPLDMMDEEDASQYENFYQEQLMQEQQEYEHQKKRQKSMYEPKDNELKLFNNKFKDKPNKPDMTGTGLIDGKQKKAAAWINQDKNGNDYFSIRFSDPNPEYDDAPKPAVQYAKNDVPF